MVGLILSLCQLETGTDHKTSSAKYADSVHGQRALILFIQTLALYKSFTYLLTYLLTRWTELQQIVGNSDDTLLSTRRRPKAEILLSAETESRPKVT